jgi:uncharacterized membrane protein
MTNLQPTATSEIREFIVEIVNTEKPETATAVIRLVQQKYPVTDEEIKEILLQLEAEDRIHFTKKTAPTPSSLSAYMFSRNSIWFWITIAVAIATALAVFSIPENAYPLVYLRQILGAIFVGFLPGYVFIKTLYPSKVPIATSSENLDALERASLSLGLSIALTAIVGLILNYTPWGIRLMPITLSLLALTMIFAIAGLLREYLAKGKLQD